MIKTINRLNVRGNPSPFMADVAIGNDALIEHYLKWKKTHAARAAVAYAVWVKRFQVFANKEPEEFTINDWIRFAAGLEGRFAPMSIQFGLSVIHNYLRYWHAQNRLPLFNLFLVRVKKARAQSHRAVTEDEYRRMVEHLKAKGDERLRDLAIIMLLHDTGMRVGELVQLEVEQIEEDSSAVIRTEKTIRERRVFWNGDTDNVLRRLVVQRVNSKTESGWLFVNHLKRKKKKSGKKPITARSVQRIMARTAKKAGIEARVSPHSFRHALIHRLAKLGVPDALIAQVVGHTTPHTISHYTKLSRPEIEEVARRQFAEQAIAA